MLSSVVTTRLGGEARFILADNYRSVLAAERMKESLERINGAALVRLTAHGAPPSDEIAANVRRFADALATEESNITEQGEADVVHRLRAGWDEYVETLEVFRGLDGPAEREAAYFSRLAPAFSRVGAQSVSLTFVTGTLSRVGSSLALALRRAPLADAQGPWDTHLRRAMLLARIWVGFLVGAMLSGVATPRYGAWVLSAPALILAALAAFDRPDRGAAG